MVVTRALPLPVYKGKLGCIKDLDKSTNTAVDDFNRYTKLDWRKSCSRIIDPDMAPG